MHCGSWHRHSIGVEVGAKKLQQSGGIRNRELQDREMKALCDGLA